MAWREASEPVRMQRVALVAPRASLRAALVRVADAGTVELELPEGNAAGRGDADQSESARRLRLLAAAVPAEPRLAATAPDLDELERNGRTDLLAGEAALDLAAAAAVTRGRSVALAGWMPAGDMGALSARLADVGGAVVPIPAPRGLDPPTALREGRALRSSFSPLVKTYATVPYADVDPTMLAGLAYVFMFGMMFGDAGHGALLVAMGLLLRAGRPARLHQLQKVWPFVVGSGLAAMGFGLLYGEFFGPTGVVPVLWLAPLEEPVTLLAAAVGVGGVLLSGAYAVGTVNRWREGGWPLALSAPSGIAGATLFLGGGLIVLGVTADLTWLTVAGGLVALSGLVLVYVGFLAAAGGGAAGITQASVELFDAVIRLGTNLVSFARLAAFGLTHAALGSVVWDGTSGLASSGGLLLVAGVVVFLVGNALTFALEALVAGVQALRLEYYELFSRVFTGEGRPFRPWHVPVDSPDPSTPTSGR